MTARRELGLFSVVCIGVNTIVGSGIFLFPATLFGLLGAMSPYAFLLAAVSASVLGMCLAEMAGRLDRTGGPMVYAAAGFGPAAGFAVGWLNFLAVVASWAAVARGVGGYVGRYWAFAHTEAGEAGIALAIVATFAAVNWIGLKPAAWVTNGFTVGKLLPLVLLAAVGLLAGNWDDVRAHDASLRDWGRAWFLCMFAMGGYEQVGVPAGETKDPMRAVPIGILGSVLVSALLYLAVQAAAVGVVPDLAHSRAPLADAAGIVLGGTGAGLLTAGAAVSMIGYTSGSAILTPRTLVALAEIGDLPEALAARHATFGTPTLAIGVGAAIALALAATAGFGALADFGMVATLLCYALSCAAVLRVRRRTDLPPARFRVPFAPVLVPVAVGLCLALATAAGWADLVTALALLVAGFALRAFVRRRGAGPRPE